MIKFSEIVDKISNNYDKKYLNSYCGVYLLELNNKFYVGSCKLLTIKSSRNGFYYRLYNHIDRLIKNKHHSRKLQNAVNKYGIENLKFDILFECDNNLTVSIEQYWINIRNL